MEEIKVNIEEGNKEILIYMGALIAESYVFNNKIEYSVHGKIIRDLRQKGFSIGGFENAALLSNMRFHQSLDWLDIVIDEIEKTSVFILHNWRIPKKHSCIISQILPGHTEQNPKTRIFLKESENSRIEAAWLAVVQFCKEHNQK